MTRPPILFPWFANLRSLKGVGEERAKQLGKLKLHLVRDLIWHLPSGVVDRRFSPPLRQAPDHGVITASVTVSEHRAPSRGRRSYQVYTHNDTGELMLSFFNVKGDYLSRLLPVGKTVFVSGQVERFYGTLQMAHPDYILPVERAQEIMRLEPIYPLTAGISHKIIRQLVAQALDSVEALPEWQDAGYLRQQGWPGFLENLRQCHQPEEAETPTAACLRLAYDELLANQLAMALTRQTMRKEAGAIFASPSPSSLPQRLMDGLPYRLTDGQMSVLADIWRDMASGDRMLRLLQGDVGSGKTIVALVAALHVVEGGCQAAMMAPTDILARQHYEQALELLTPLGIRVGYMSGSIKGKARQKQLEALASGEVDVMFGTHALFQHGVDFHRLGLVVVDEQHRFGVEQRLALVEKGLQTGMNPHVLLMSATPIPRSLTLAWFGDMDTSRLIEKPAGRQKIDTRAMPLSRYGDIVLGLGRAMAQGAQIYWVCPLVEESEALDLAAVTKRYEELCQAFPGKVVMVHGRMSAQEKESTIQRFAKGEAAMLVATTVIEVGVNVPQATVMVIEHAERFGLAQLHQLRGRVGRGNAASSCLLLYADQAGETAKERLLTIRNQQDGFAIAEEDLRLRGGGNLLGTQQSGMPLFRFADLYQHRELLQTAHDDARLILNRDPKLTSERGKALRVLLHLFEYEQLVGYIAAG